MIRHARRIATLPEMISRALIWFYLVLVMTTVVAISVSRGTDTYYDLLNIKWFSGWSLITGNFDLSGIASTRITQPPIHDGLQVLLNYPNMWWVPPTANALAHSLLVVLVFGSCRSLLPSMLNWPAAIFASLAVLSPLVLMQAGTSSGHLYAALFLAGALRVLITSDGRSSQAFLSGCLLGAALLMKSSTIALMPSLAVGAILMVGSGPAAVALLGGVAAGYGAIAIPWSTFATVRAGRPLSQVGFPGVPKGMGVLVVLGVLILVALGLSVWVRGRRSTRSLRTGGLSEAIFRVLLVAVLVLVPVTAFNIRRVAPDFRFLIEEPSQLLRRWVHTGDLVFGFETLDLEVGYFDTRMPVATLLVFASLAPLALVLFASKNGRLRKNTGIVLFCALPMVVNVWSTGYSRYAVEVVPLIPVAVIALASMVPFDSWIRRATLLFGAFVLVFPILPNGRLSAGVPRFGQVEFTAPIYEPYLSNEERQFISDLLPEDAPVLGVGSLISYVAPSLNRRDLKWSFERPSRTEVAVLKEPLFLIYQPAEAMLLRGYVDRGIVLERCEVLRFDHSDIGWCRASTAD